MYRDKILQGTILNENEKSDVVNIVGVHGSKRKE